MPSYREGDRFEFVGGRVEQVVGSENGLVRWRRENGREVMSPSDFVQPFASRESSRTSVSHRLLNQAGELWPLALGKQDTFLVERRRQDKASGEVKTSLRSFDCVVDDAETMTVSAGTFDTYQITCRRYNSRGTRLIESQEWHYAPAIGHYIRRKTELHSNDRVTVIELKNFRRAGA